MDAADRVFSSLPFVKRSATPRLGAEGADAFAFADQVHEAADVVSEWGADHATAQAERTMTEIVLLFASAVASEAARVVPMLEAGVGLGGMDPGPLLAKLDRDRLRLVVARDELLRLVRDAREGQAKDATNALLTASGIVKGAPADAVADERALYDG